MTTLMLVSDAFGGSGGIARFNRELAGALSRRPEDRVVVWPRVCGGEPDAPAARVAQAPPAGRFRLAMRAAAAALGAARYDLVVCGHLYLAPVAAMAARRRPLWLVLHGIEAWPRPASRWVRAAVERADLVTAVSRYTRERFLEWADVPPHRVRVLPDTVDARFRPGDKPAALLDRWQLRGKKVLLTVGRLDAAERYKGHEDVIRCVARLGRRRGDLVYLIVGDGNDRARLERLAAEEGAAERVRFAGRVPDAELADAYRAADAFVMPSTGEGFGIVYLEAARTGLPLVAYDAAGARDALRDGAEGRLVPTGDLAALERALEAAVDAGAAPAPGAGAFGEEAFGAHARRLAESVGRQAA